MNHVDVVLPMCFTWGRGEEGLEGKGGGKGDFSRQAFMIFNVSICFDTCLHKQKPSDYVYSSNGSTHLIY